MYMQRFASALAASAVVAGVAAVGCSDSTVKITSQADAEQAAACRTIKGSIVIDTDDNSNTDLDFQGLQEVKGDFTAKGNKGLQSIMANDLTTIGGVFTLTNLIKLSTLQMQKLEETAGIDFSTLTNLASFDFGYATGGTGITKADSVTIVDTFLQSIDGINVKDPSTIQIISNDRLSNFTSTVETLSDIVVVRDNALQLSVAFPELIWASNITVQNASSLEVPNLKVVNGSLRIENNIFKSFEAPKLTETSEGDIAFISNGDMTKMSFPVFTECAGGFTIANNTKLTAIDGFPKLETIGGAGALRGSFKTVKLDSLESVKGGFDIVSTESIADVCTKFKAMDGSEIQGKVFCDPNNADANSDTSTADSNGSGKGGKNGDGDSAASIMGMSMSTVMSIAGLGMMFTML